jgi:hypothetical protein
MIYIVLLERINRIVYRSTLEAFGLGGKNSPHFRETRRNPAVVRKRTAI